MMKSEKSIVDTEVANDINKSVTAAEAKSVAEDVLIKENYEKTIRLINLAKNAGQTCLTIDYELSELSKKLLEGQSYKIVKQVTGTGRCSTIDWS